MARSWSHIPYHTIGEYYHKKFSEKVYKIPLSIVDDCPNRRGLKGMQTCIFCDPWGSAARSETLTMPLKQQIVKVRDILHRKHKAETFLAYFQAYTNTFTKVSALRAHFETALEFPFIKGFVIGTRPDCISPAVLQLWNEFTEKSYVSIELGVQTFDDAQLLFLRRGHSAQDSLKAIEKISQNVNADLGLHLIFGNPGETDEQIIKTAELCNQLPIQNVKLHNLHVLKKTPLEDLYNGGLFQPIDFAEYSKRVQLFIQHLSPRIAIHRLAAYSSRQEELVAPAWTMNKIKTHQELIDDLLKSRSLQGSALLSLDDTERNIFETITKRCVSPPHPL